MKNSSIKLLLVILIFNFSSCKQGNGTFSDYQFAEETPLINCEDADNKLLNEALYSFENDITSYFEVQERNTNRAYRTFLTQAVNKKTDLTKYASKHSVALAAALKNAGFIGDNGVNYNNPIITCLADNMKKGDLATTFNALVSTNSMRRDLYAPALRTKISTVSADKYLSMYVALEYFYADILKTDFTNINFNRPNYIKPKPTQPAIKADLNNSKVDFNKRPRKQ